jgi:glycosidase
MSDILTRRNHGSSYFQIDGIRMDSVENVANWDFIRDFKDAARAFFRQRYPTARAAADAKFLVVGEALEMPPELLNSRRLDGLWNERFQGLARAALLGESADGLNVEDTVCRAIDCGIDRVFDDGARAINYLTSHDVEGRRKERLYNVMQGAISLASSELLFDRRAIESDVRERIRREGREPGGDEVRLRRIKLGFVCQMTAVGIPVILAGEEFGDQHDLFDSRGHVTHQGGKQVDPVNFPRFDDPESQGLVRVRRTIGAPADVASGTVGERDQLHPRGFQRGEAGARVEARR